MADCPTHKGQRAFTVSEGATHEEAARYYDNGDSGSAGGLS